MPGSLSTKENSRSVAGCSFGCGFGPVRLTAPVRVTSRELGGRRCVLAYEALPGHPESGAEEFVVVRHDHDAVWFEISVDSRPGPWWASAVAPIARILQHDFTVRYLLAARQVGRP